MRLYGATGKLDRDAIEVCAEKTEHGIRDETVEIIGDEGDGLAVTVRCEK